MEVKVLGNIVDIISFAHRTVLSFGRGDKLSNG